MSREDVQQVLCRLYTWAKVLLPVAWNTPVWGRYLKGTLVWRLILVLLFRNHLDWHNLGVIILL
jgi:hypothetical protein